MNAALNILKKNMQRIIDDPDEEEEKYTLSITLLHFLKWISANPKLRSMLQNCGEVLTSVLVSE